MASCPINPFSRAGRLSSFTHHYPCNNLNLQPLSVGADATIYVWFLCQMAVHKNQTYHIRSGCNGICLVSVPDTVAVHKNQTYHVASTVAIGKAGYADSHTNCRMVWEILYLIKTLFVSLLGFEPMTQPGCINHWSVHVVTTGKTIARHYWMVTC